MRVPWGRSRTWSTIWSRVWELIGRPHQGQNVRFSPADSSQLAPRTGPSGVAAFSVMVPGDIDTVEIMIVVLHRGTHIQTGYLYTYAFAMIIGLTMLLGWLIWMR